MGKNPCAGCKYLYNPYHKKNTDYKWQLCQYYLMTGVRRPCKGGAECTVKELNPRKRQKKGLTIKNGTKGAI